MTLEIFGRHRARGPAEPRQRCPKLGSEATLPTPRLDDQYHADKRTADREPLAAAHALVQHRPGDEHRPERHGEYEHGSAARAATGDRHRRGAEVDRRLEESSDDDRGPRFGLERTPLPHHDREQQHDRDQRALDVEANRVRVPQPEFHHAPVHAPDERKKDQRSVRRSLRSDAKQVLHYEPRNGSIAAATASGRSRWSMWPAWSTVRSSPRGTCLRRARMPSNESAAASPSGCAP